MKTKNKKKRDDSTPWDKNSGISLANMAQEHTHVSDCDACGRGDRRGIVV
jgi:hypothetical protein